MEKHKNKRAFTFTEIIVAMLLISITATLALTLYSTAYDTNRSANDTCFLEMVQIGVLEDLQKNIDDGGEVPPHYEVITDSGKFAVKTELDIDQDCRETGKLYYLVKATSRIGGTASRKLITKVVMTRQTGGLYENYG